MRVADSVGRKTGAHEQRLFYFRSSRAPLTSESTTRPRHASSSPFTSLVSVISLIVLAARSVAGWIAFTFFSLSSPVSATCSYCPRPARPAWPRQRSGNQRPQFLILLSRVLVPFFSLFLRLTVRRLTEPVCCRSSYRPHALFLVLFSFFASSPSSSPDRSLQACDPFYLAYLFLYVPVKTLAPCLRSYKIANVLKCPTTIPTFFHFRAFAFPPGRGLVSPLLSNSRLSPHRFNPFT